MKDKITVKLVEGTEKTNLRGLFRNDFKMELYIFDGVRNFVDGVRLHSSQILITASCWPRSPEEIIMFQ